MHCMFLHVKIYNTYFFIYLYKIYHIYLIYFHINSCNNFHVDFLISRDSSFSVRHSWISVRWNFVTENIIENVQWCNNNNDNNNESELTARGEGRRTTAAVHTRIVVHMLLHWGCLIANRLRCLHTRAGYGGEACTHFVVALSLDILNWHRTRGGERLVTSSTRIPVAALP